MGIAMLFIGVGCLVIFIGSVVNEGRWFLYIFGGTFIGFSLFFLIATMPSSFAYYYEQALVKKYGSYGTAFIRSKAVLDRSYTEKRGVRAVQVAQYHYELTYEYEYLQQVYTNTFHVAGKSCFDSLSIGATIPIQYLKVKPNQSTVRRVKLSKELGLDRKECA